MCMSTVIAMTACGGTTSSSGESKDVVVEDDSTLVKKVLLPLPDTAYKSAEIVKYRIDVPDTTISGDINSLVDLYADTPGTFTFRKGGMRQADFGGVINGTPSEISVDWEFITDIDNRETKMGTWGGGSGWTGQPLYVNWPDSILKKFAHAGINCPNQEIIVGSLASKVYFIDYNTGKKSRPAVDVFNPIKGTISLDPTLNGNLYVGQGIPATKPFGSLVIDLYKGMVTHTIPQDPKAQRGWQAYDSSPIRVGQFLFWPGENGTIYKYMISPGTLQLHSALRYTVDARAPGVESSMAVYLNYGYISDNRGNIICLNLNTMKPVWRSSTGDDTDATPVIGIENGHPFIYVGSEIDLQDVGNATFLKVDGITGETVWNSKIPGRRINRDDKHFDGGFYATALLGTGDCKDLVFSNCVTNEKGQSGDFVALNRMTGKIVYRTRLKYYAWSSPVSLIDSKGKMYIVTGDCSGNIYVIEGLTGKILLSKRIGNNFESSPVIIPGTSSLVVGSRGNSIFKITIK